MRPHRLLIAILPLAGAFVFSAADADGEVAARGGHVETPASSIEQPEHVGVRAHTNFKAFKPDAHMGGAQRPRVAPQAGGPPYAGYFFETPASLACVYQLTLPPVPGCNPNIVSANLTGGGRAIAIVDAYHYPTAAADLSVFSSQFGLPQANFQIVYANGRQPSVNSDWNIEEALDIEWAHGMAPAAKIYLVEAASTSYNDLLAAVLVANSLLSQTGGGEVSMSWGGSEFSGETGYDSYFTQPGVVYFGASGDSPGVVWPSTSPNVVGVGGTSLSRNPTTGALQQEMAWQSGGGGPSLYESRPGYQAVVSAMVQGQRGAPDVAADADPSTGAWVYAAGSWYIIGGTSLATPVWAGIANAAGKFKPGSQVELTKLYKNHATTDVMRGSCGPNQGYIADSGWDFCTGFGSPNGLSRK